MRLIDNSASDEVLWTMVCKGNETAFEMIYARFFKLLYNYGRKVCTNKIIVEDAIHDLFLDLWRYRENLSPTTSVRFYLYCALRRRIIKNETKDLESSVFNFQLDEILNTKSFSQEEMMIETERQSDQKSKLKKYLHHLSPRQYEALVLRFYDEFSYTEIGSILNINEQSARNLIQRGVEHLKSFSRIVISILMVLCLTYNT